MREGAVFGAAGLRRAGGAPRGAALTRTRWRAVDAAARRARRPQEVQDYLKTICNDLHVTKGEFDEGSYPETKARTLRQRTACAHAGLPALGSGPTLQRLHVTQRRVWAAAAALRTRRVRHCARTLR